MKYSKYHDIKQFKDIVKAVQSKADYKGKDEEGNPIYENTGRPTLTFKGTVKLHGTNASITYTPKTGVIAGKRSSSINPEDLQAHMGFNQFVQVTHKDYFEELCSKLWKEYCTKEEQLIIYGEWAGKSIQKGVAISELPKAFYIFDIKVYNEMEDSSKWLDIVPIPISIEDNIYKITEFGIWNIEIDFNNPGLSQNKLIELTTKVEEECPVSKQLGISGVGEGIVWKTEWEGERFIFKVKGEKHSSSKVKVLASVDEDVLTSIQDFVEYACTDNRIKQGIQETGATEKKDIPNLLKWVSNDIIKEEDAALQANNLEWKQVASSCNNKVKQYFFSLIDKI